MGKRDPRVDGYIAKSAPFAKPILRHLRNVVHASVPGVEETMKWGFPHFDYQGMMCSMASFKEHCVFGFWKASLLADPKKILGRMGKTAMGQFGRIASLDDLPSEKILTAYIKEAARLNADGVKLAPRARAPRKALFIPAFFTSALKKNKKALATFEAFSYSHRKEYVVWVTEAKTEETRARRLATAVEWLAEGKPHNWRYMKK